MTKFARIHFCKWIAVCLVMCTLGAVPSATIHAPVEGSHPYDEYLEWSVSVDSDPAAEPENKPVATVRIWLKDVGNAGPEIWFDTTSMSYGNYTQTAIPDAHWPIGYTNPGATVTVGGLSPYAYTAITFYDPGSSGG